MEQAELDIVYTKFLDLADTRKEIYDEDLLEMLGHSRDNKIYQIESLDVNSHSHEGSIAHVTLCRNEHFYTSEAKGNGPVDAVLKAIDNIVDPNVKLEEYLVQAITGGSNDVGKVHIQVSYEGVFYYGFGSDTDIVLASAKAYIDALNKL
jgi:2-isopropylmalate synthase